VQSGKTANYIWSDFKAAEAGYKFLIIIAGIHNNLRKQLKKGLTQVFVGVTVKVEHLRGVGRLIDQGRFNYTDNTLSDFSKQQASTLQRISKDSAGLWLLL